MNILKNSKKFVISDMQEQNFLEVVGWQHFTTTRNIEEATQFSTWKEAEQALGKYKPIVPTSEIRYIVPINILITGDE